MSFICRRLQEARTVSLTEFHGQPTRTCLAIGPDDADKTDAVTGHLQLLSQACSPAVVS